MNSLLLYNSLVVGIITTIASLFIGFVVALWISGLPAGWRSVCLAAAVVALALPPFLVTNCWLHYFGITGVWHRWLPINIFSTAGTIWILTLLFWPVGLFFVWGAWQRLQPAHIESEPLARGWPLIRFLLFPLARPAMGQAALILLVLALNNFAVPAILQVKVFPAEMWVRFNTTFDTWGALKQSWPLLLGPLALLTWFTNREVSWPRRQELVPPALFRRQLGLGWFWAGGACSLFVIVCSVFLPMFEIVSVSRTWTELPGALEAGQRALYNSIIYSVAGASIVMAIALWRVNSSANFAGAGKGGSRPRTGFLRGICGSANGVAYALAWLAFLLPGVLLGIGLIHAFNHSWTAAFYTSAGIVILAYAVRYLALGIYAAGYAAQSMDRSLADVARLEGATKRQMMRFVVWPQIRRPVSVAWYVLFLLCLWDVETIVLVVPPGGETLSLRIFNLLHYGHNAQVNALCFLLVIVGLLPLFTSQVVAWSSSLVRGWGRAGRRPGLLAACLLAGVLL
ncbi:MAG TPA: ABC transporter permease subunit, partial [Verrucomicrobiae bacterium]|nr:ABC transporter permease subunit [Verrucomicrobiae bacterium]